MTDKPDNWPKHPNGENKAIGEMTDEESRPLLRASFYRSKIGAPPEDDDERPWPSPRQPDDDDIDF